MWVVGNNKRWFAFYWLAFQHVFFDDLTDTFFERQNIILLILLLSDRDYSNPLWTSRGKKKQAAPKTIVLSNHPKLGYLFWNSLWLDFQGMFFVANWTHSHWISSWDQPRSSHPRRPCGDGGHTTCLRLLSVEIQYVKDPRATIFGIIYLWSYPRLP